MNPENKVDELRQQQIYLKMRQLMGDHELLLRAMGSDGVDFRHASASDDYLDRLSAMLLDDNAEALGRLLIDQMVHFMWALAEQQVDLGSNTSTH
jgi:hypothetical protein